MSVILETSLGDIVVDLYVKERPKCSKNFLKLCKIKYYNFCLFHGVQQNLVAQTGDPTGTGRGGGSIFEKLYGEQARYFDAEVKPRIKHLKRGTLSMVNNGSAMHGSQFFLTLAECIDYLDGEHTVFGEVAEGFDVLDKINEAYVDSENRPYKDIRIYHTVVLDDPFDDPSGLAEIIPDRSPEATKEQLDSGRIGAEEDIDKTKGKSEHEIEEMLQDNEAKANAQILEMVGDLPTADTEAPDNVLFVCKLNPVTSSEDLEVIFSRFGNIVSCEVIKDKKTEESLQYAFIEFEKPEECENAYFKMDNVLIDDRRIHVDFSQSVSQLKYKNPKAKLDHAQLKIKDKSKKDGYDLVYSDDEGRSVTSKRHKSKKSKHKKKHKHSSDGSDLEERRKSEKEYSNSRNKRDHYSPSPPPKKRYRSKSRSRSPRNRRYNDKDSARHEKYRDRDRTRRSSPVGGKRRSHSRDRYSDHQSKRDKYR